MSSSDRPNIIVIGSSNMDLIIKVPHLPKPGETVGSGNFYKKYGGKGGNQAVAAARAGARVTLVTCIGNDAHGDELLSNYTHEKILTHNIIRSDRPTGVAIINVSNSSGENSISVAPGANHDLQPKHINQGQLFNNQEYLILQNEIPKETIEYIISNAPTFIKIVYNPAPYFSIPKELLQRIDILVLNETETKELLNITEIESSHAEIGIKLSKLSLKKVVITLGKNGCYHWECGNDYLTHTKGLPVKAVDTTGAGDTFCGYLTVGLSKNRSLSESVKAANSASAMAVQKIGAQESIPFISDISI